MRGSIKDLTGQRFGRLVVLGDNGKRKHGHVCWKCKCDCGKEALIPSNDLISGKTTSCGCFRQEAAYERRVNKLDTNGADIKRILNCNIDLNNTSGYKGIYWNKKNKQWRAEIGYATKRYHLLYSHNINDCIAVRQEAEQAVKDGNFLEWITAYKGHK